MGRLHEWRRGTLKRAPRKAFARLIDCVSLLCFAVMPGAWAASPFVTVHATMQSSGALELRVWPVRPGLPFDSAVAARMVRCQGAMKSGDEGFGTYSCAHALRRDGLALEAVLDLSPVLEKLPAGEELDLWLEYPRLGFDSAPVPLRGNAGRWNVVRTMRFAAGSAPGPIEIRFGYRADQLSRICMVLAGLAATILLVALLVSRAGYEHLNMSILLLGTMIWIGTDSALKAPDLFRILLLGMPLAGIVVSLLEFCPALAAVALGAAFGTKLRPDQSRSDIFGAIFWGYGTFLFPMAIVLGAVSAMAEGNWLNAAGRLAVAVASVVLCRWRSRAISGAKRVRLTEGALKNRVAELGAKLGYKNVQVFISSSIRSQSWNAFAMLRNTIVLTAPLVESLTKREVDAIMAHELSHFGHKRRSPWMALAVAVALSQTPLIETLIPGINAAFVTLGAPLILFFWALAGARKREFEADAGSVALTGDARALIGGLARISRHSGKPLQFNPLVEWFSTHPSTHKRLRALARLGGVGAAELEELSRSDAEGEKYSIPVQELGAVFTAAWQRSHAIRYSWGVLVGTSTAGLSIAWLLMRFWSAGLPQFAVGVAAGCCFIEILAVMLLAWSFGGLKRRLARKLARSGQLVGLALESEPRVYNGYRFSDVGFFGFEEGRLCYRSERVAIALNPADVLVVALVPAAPAAWRRMQPMLRFRHPESGEVKGFILHPLVSGSGARLFRSIERWKAARLPAMASSVTGFQEVAGQPFQPPSVRKTARGLRIPGAITLVGAMVAGWILPNNMWAAWYALAITAGAYTFVFLPAMLYRLPGPRPMLEPGGEIKVRS